MITNDNTGVDITFRHPLSRNLLMAKTRMIRTSSSYPSVSESRYRNVRCIRFPAEYLRLMFTNKSEMSGNHKLINSYNRRLRC